MNDTLENDFRPLGMLVLIRREAAKKKIGDIILPDASVSRSRFGTVIRVGPGSDHDGIHRDVPLKIGDVVMFDQLADRFAIPGPKGEMVPISDEFAGYALVPEIAVMGTMNP
jgi:co-chaperonin GroES (HSP10)